MLASNSGDGIVLSLACSVIWAYAPTRTPYVLEREQLFAFRAMVEPYFESRLFREKILPL